MDLIFRLLFIGSGLLISYGVFNLLSKVLKGISLILFMGLIITICLYIAVESSLGSLLQYLAEGTIYGIVSFCVSKETKKKEVQK